MAALDLLRERGASRLTTKEVALRAGVSEGSVFYHFADRLGLLTAVVEAGLQTLKSTAGGGITGGDVRATLDGFTTGVENLLDPVLAVLIAAQSDAELRSGVADYLIGNDLGPHRGVQALGEYLAGQQALGRIRDDVDPQAVAFLVVSSCFLRVGQRQMISPDYGPGLPGRVSLTDTMERLLRPASPPAAS